MSPSHPMNTFLRRSPAILAAAALLAVASPLAAQQSSRGGQAEFRWSKSIAAGHWVRLHNISGDVSVTAHDGDRVELVATRRGASDDAQARVEVKEHAGGVTICALRGDEAYCDERGIRSEGGGYSSRGRRQTAYYHLEVRVPRRARVAASSVSGDVRVAGATGEMRATSVSGDVRLDNVHAGNRLTASTVSGRVTARLESVARGTSLELKSVSGDVAVSMPRTTGLDLTMSTVSGSLHSDFELAMRGRFNRRRIEAQVNNGGSDLRISTVSGDVRLAHN